MCAKKQYVTVSFIGVIPFNGFTVAGWPPPICIWVLPVKPTNRGSVRCKSSRMTTTSSQFPVSWLMNQKSAAMPLVMTSLSYLAKEGMNKYETLHYPQFSL